MRTTLAAGLLVVMLAVAGCRSGTAAAPVRRPEGVAPITSTDPCAARLHDICGALLMYYALHHELPADVQALRHPPGVARPLDLTCPVSGRAYTYNRAGLVGRTLDERIILYDAAPSHDGMRWAICIVEPAPGEPLIANVVALPEARFPRGAP